MSVAPIQKWLGFLFCKLVVYFKVCDMQKYLFIVLAGVLIIGCGEDEKTHFSEDEVISPNDTIMYLKADMVPVNGMVRFYFNNGQLKHHGYKDASGKCGLWKMWYKNGELRQKGNYKADLKDGVWYLFDLKGWEIKKTKYNPGDDSIFIGESAYFKNAPIPCTHQSGNKCGDGKLPSGKEEGIYILSGLLIKTKP